MRCLVLAHFDKDGGFDPHLQFALREYKKYYHTIIVVSVSCKEKPSDLIDIFISRENVGYDFLSYKTGLDAIVDKSIYDEITIANDSIYGPFASLEPCFTHKNIENADIWGMVASNQMGYHLQSWFITFRRAAISNAAFAQFWDNMPIHSDKSKVINLLEVGLTPHFMKAGLTVKAIYHNETTVNQPMQKEALYIIKEIPIVKVMFLRDYPTFYDVIMARRIIKKANPAYFKAIVAHMRRTRIVKNKKFLKRVVKLSVYSALGLVFGQKFHEKIRK